MMVEACRVCGGRELRSVLSLGSTPLANRFLSHEQLDSLEPRYPLDVLFCAGCGLVCLSVVVPPEQMFREYIYVSSTSDTIPRHFAQLAAEVVERFMDGRSRFAVEIGSNDGCLLRGFRGHDVRVLGVEPATNLAALARGSGIPTVNGFFSEALGRTIRTQYDEAQVVLATNVVAHIDDLADLIRGVTHLLAPDGVMIIEVPYLLDLIDRCEYDTIYHEHLSYFSVGTLAALLARFGMVVFDFQRLSMHGGSIRVYASRSGRRQICRSVGELRELESRRGLGDCKTYQAFARSVERNRVALRALLERLKGEGARLVGYGAPAKGNTLLNYCGIGTEFLDYVVDRSPYKHGLYTPGMRVPVFPVERLLGDLPDYALLLAWNFAEEIMEQQAEYRAKGGRFILPIPDPAIL